MKLRKLMQTLIEIEKLTNLKSINVFASQVNAELTMTQQTDKSCFRDANV